jgi:hypothetical protein
LFCIEERQNPSLRKAKELFQKVREPDGTKVSRTNS